MNVCMYKYNCKYLNGHCSEDVHDCDILGGKTILS